MRVDSNRSLRAVGLLALGLALVPSVASAHRGGWWVARGPYWGWGGWGGAWGYTVVYPMVDRTHGALDLDVSPERAEIYIDGERVGEADDFDGFPDFLWLEKGTYDVVIFHPGFQTISRQISIYAGQVIDVEDRMTPGQETRPEDLGATSTVNREERLRRDRELEEEVRRSEAGERRERRAPRSNEAIDARGEPGRARVHVTPEDASVYLDGRFLGTARELARLRSGLIVDAGEHEIEAVRPGLEPASREFTVGEGEEIDVTLHLAPED
jgi:hypothetical protein